MLSSLKPALENHRLRLVGRCSGQLSTSRACLVRVACEQDDAQYLTQGTSLSLCHSETKRFKCWTWRSEAPFFDSMFRHTWEGVREPGQQAQIHLGGHQMRDVRPSAACHTMLIPGCLKRVVRTMRPVRQGEC